MVRPKCSPQDLREAPIPSFFPHHREEAQLQWEAEYAAKVAAEEARAKKEFEEFMFHMSQDQGTRDEIRKEQELQEALDRFDCQVSGRRAIPPARGRACVSCHTMTQAV